MTSFWTELVQNGVVLKQLSHTQNDVVWVSDSCFKTTPFWTNFVQNDVVLDQFCPKRRRFVMYFKKIKMKRRRFISSRDKTTSFCQPPCPNEVSVRRSSLQRGRGGGGEDKATSPAAAHLDRRAHMISELAAAAGD